jgi:hypothetical protein
VVESSRRQGGDGFGEGDGTTELVIVVVVVGVVVGVGVSGVCVVLTWAVSHQDVAASEWFGDFIVPGGMDGWNGWGYYLFICVVFMLVLSIDCGHPVLSIVSVVFGSFSRGAFVGRVCE